MDKITKALQAAIEPVVDEIHRVEKKVDNVKLTPGPAGEPGSAGEAGPPGESPSAESVAKIIAEKYPEKVAGSRGEQGEKGAPGVDGVSPDPVEIAGTVAVELVTNHLEVIKGPEGISGKDGEPGSDGKDGAGIDVDLWEDKVYREGSVVVHDFGRIARAVKDTAEKPGKSADWQRVGTGGFRWRGIKNKYADYEDGDLYIDNGTTFLYLEGKGRMFAKRGRDGKPGKDAPTPIDFRWEQEKLLMIFDDGTVLSTDAEQIVEHFAKSISWIKQAESQAPENSTPVGYYRGVWKANRAYRSGDLATFSGGLYLCQQSAPAGTELKEPYWSKLAGQGAGSKGFAAGTMIWRNQFVDTPQGYAKNEVVRDGSWTMIANKPTFDKAAPQEVGPATWTLADAPPWLPPFSDTSVIHSGHLYTFTEGGYFKGLRVWVPELTATTNYNIVIIKNPNGPDPQYLSINDPILNDNDWTVLTLDVSLVIPGDQLLVFIDALNSGSTSEWSYNWQREADHNSNPPSPGFWRTNNNQDFLRINWDDAEAVPVNHQLELQVVPNTIFEISEVGAPEYYVHYKVSGAYTEGASWTEYQVTVASINNGGPRDGIATQIKAVQPVASPTTFIGMDAYWGTVQPMPSWGIIQSSLEFDGVPQAIQGDECYGVDVAFQQLDASEDWDLIAYSALSSGGEGISSPGAQAQGSFSRRYKAASNLGGALSKQEIEATITDPLPLPAMTSFWIYDNASQFLVVWDGAYYHFERLTRVT